jgi:hypothetical protein
MFVRAKPIAKVARSTAIKLVQEHEAEIRRSAVSLSRRRLRGPLGLAAAVFIDAVQLNPRPAAQLACPACAALNPRNANFCGQCGSRLSVAGPSTAGPGP